MFHCLFGTWILKVSFKYTSASEQQAEGIYSEREREWRNVIFLSLLQPGKKGLYSLRSWNELFGQPPPLCLEILKVEFVLVELYSFLRFEQLKIDKKCPCMKYGGNPINEIESLK